MCDPLAMFAKDLKLFGLPTTSLPSDTSELKAAYRRKIEEVRGGRSATRDEVSLTTSPPPILFLAD